jgi:hypothetical protein
MNMNMKLTFAILVLTQLLSQPAQISRIKLLQAGSKNGEPSPTAPQCEIAETNQITIACVFSPASASDADARSVPRVVLNRAEMSFKTSSESHMRIQLSFTNESGSQISEQRTVYLAIDDEKGQNHMRRPLPQVDFTKLDPGKLTNFEETLLAPAFSPGPYMVSLWIPSTEPSWKFDPAHNVLLSSAGVPDPATGLNLVAKFKVGPRGKRNSSAVPD